MIKNLVHDFIKSFLIGAACSGIAAVIFFLGGFLTGHFVLENGMEALKNGLLILAALGMFLLAGMIMMKGKKPEKFKYLDSWRKQFYVFGYKVVLGMICFVTILTASLADYILYMIK